MQELLTRLRSKLLFKLIFLLFVGYLLISFFALIVEVYKSLHGLNETLAAVVGVVLIAVAVYAASLFYTPQWLADWQTKRRKAKARKTLHQREAGLHEKLTAKDNTIDEAFYTPGDTYLIPVFGRAYVGKSTAVKYLNAQFEDQEYPVEADWSCIKVPAITTDDRANQAKVQAFSGARIAVFMLLEDLTCYEMNAITAASKAAEKVLVILNKCDRYRASEVAEIVESIEQKLIPYREKVLGPIAVSLDPGPIMRILTHDDGREEETEFKPRCDPGELLVTLSSIQGEQH